MSQPSSRKQRRPPQRLSWPTSLSQGSTGTISNNNGSSTKQESKQQQQQQQQPKNDKGNNTRKRARVSDVLPTTSTTVVDNSVMWVEKFAPKSSSDLCVAPKKVKEIMSWIQSCVSDDSHSPGYCDNTSSSDGNTNLSNISSSQDKKQKLLVLVGSPGVGKSTTIRLIAKELNLPILSWNESINPRGEQDGMDSRSLFSVEQTSALDSFNEFLQQSGAGFGSLQMMSSSSANKASKNNSNNINNNNISSNSIILLEDLPNLHGKNAELRFRTYLSNHLQRSQVPTVLVFSDVSEGKHKPEDLERLIDPNDLYDNDRTTIVQINSVTKPKMKKILAAIAKREKYRFDSNFLEEIHHQSRGDIRHAVMTLQLHATGRSKSDCATTTTLHRGQNNRDTKLSAFHSLGKILYAKRVSVDGGDPRLTFDPEAILERSDLGVDGSLRFLEFHSPDFFTDITELSNAYGHFSDAAFLLGHDTVSGSRSNDNGSVFKYASSIAGRAVANTNIHPAPNKFRQFSRPKVFDVIRNGKQNQILVDQLSRRLSKCHCPLSNFVTESLPFVRQIVPQDVDPFLDNLYSVAMQRHKEKMKVIPENDDDLGLKVQQALLDIDDIDEFDSGDDDDLSV
jgi:cell cycle checkpoint protein